MRTAIIIAVGFVLWAACLGVAKLLASSSTSSIEFIPLSFWYDAPLISRDDDRRHDPWLVYGSPTYRPARWSFWISPA
jgi:hypothetical protein